jgi:hypothetical protein
MFKAIVGITPRAYAAAHRARRVRDELGCSHSVTEAVYGAGFSSSGRFCATAGEVLGMTPTRFRADGAGVLIRFAGGGCSLGWILVAARDRGVCAILLGDTPDPLARKLQDRFPRARLHGGDRRFQRLVARMVGSVEAPAVGLDLPLDLRETAFQQRVWRALRRIPARDGHLPRGGQAHGCPERGAGGRAGVRVEHARGRDSLPPRRSERRGAVGLSLGDRAEARSPCPETASRRRAAASTLDAGASRPEAASRRDGVHAEAAAPSLAREGRVLTSSRGARGQARVPGRRRP